VVKEIMDRIGGGQGDQEAVALVDRLIAQSLPKKK
jgi:hypothetical protein